jgi:hypothetical protein
MPAELFGQFFGREKIGEEAGRHCGTLLHLERKCLTLNDKGLSNNAF